jgi:predicted SnoaL-like aldol condensation-catalyzing enzyme
MSYEIFFQRLAAAVTARDLDHVAEWFTEDFRLHEPGFDIPNGHAGAEAMLRTFLKLGPSMKVEVVDVIEAGDRAAVRWVFSGERDGEAVTIPCIAMYRFVGGRIAEDWGITSTKGPWP